MAAAGTIGAGAIGAIQETVGQAHDALAGILPYLDAAKWALLAVTLIGIGVMLWARIDDPAKGAALMWLLVQGWLLRNVLTLLGWLAAAVTPVLSPGSPAAPQSASRPCGGLWRCSVTSSRLRAVVLAIAASLLAGCATARTDGSPCPAVVAYSREFLARVAGELDSLPAGSAIEQSARRLSGRDRRPPMQS